jgi:hypothetical protein
MRFVDKEFIFGKMARSTKENGLIIKCMERAS